MFQQHARLFTAHYDAAATHLPRFATDEFDAYLACGMLAHGFMRLTCDTCAKDSLMKSVSVIHLWGKQTTNIGPFHPDSTNLIASAALNSFAHLTPAGQWQPHL